MKKWKVIQAICDCTDPRDNKAGIADIARALGMGTQPPDLDRLTAMLMKYPEYVEARPADGCVWTTRRAFAENARHERARGQLWQWIYGSMTAIAAVVLGFFLGKFFS